MAIRVVSTGLALCKEKSDPSDEEFLFLQEDLTYAYQECIYEAEEFAPPLVQGLSGQKYYRICAEAGKSFSAAEKPYALCSSGFFKSHFEKL